MKLLRKSQTRAMSVYQVTNTAGDFLGSISCRPEEEADLLKYWAGPKGAPGPANPPEQSGRSAFARALRTLSLNGAGRRAILRGC